MAKKETKTVQRVDFNIAGNAGELKNALSRYDAESELVLHRDLGKFYIHVVQKQGPLLAIIEVPQDETGDTCCRYRK